MTKVEDGEYWMVCDNVNCRHQVWFVYAYDIPSLEELAKRSGWMLKKQGDKEIYTCLNCRNQEIVNDN